MTKKYKHIFFDLDHTLWDFNTNCKETLQELFNTHDLGSLLQCKFNLFKTQYLKVNALMWSQYNQQRITKEEMRKFRFNSVLHYFNHYDEALGIRLDAEYIDTCPKKGALIEGALEILDYLKPNYQLHILTNGFKTTQKTKLKYSGIDSYFTSMTTSECTGFTKPSPIFFKHHLKKINAFPHECIMIGDNLISDIRGAHNSKIDSVFFDIENSTKFLKGKQTHYITELLQIKKIL